MQILWDNLPLNIREYVPQDSTSITQTLNFYIFDGPMFKGEITLDGSIKNKRFKPSVAPE